MGRYGRLLILLFLLMAPAFPVSARPSVSIIPFDQLAQPNQSVRLAARLVTGGLSFVRRPISGERIEFMLEGRSLGRTLTGGDGMAVKSFAPSKPGLYIITVRLVENPRYEADPAELYIACRKVSDPILPVALSSVQTPGNPTAIPFSAAPSSEAMPEAAKILSKLSKRYQLVYIDTGDETIGPDVKDWLARRDFPPAPLFVWALPGEAAGRVERFVERLRELRGDVWANIPAGITRSTADAEGLARMKIPVIVMAEEDDDIELPKTARKVTSWKAVPSLLK
ncbi:MAG: hypothetical protein HY283_08150 [Nitrospirae bacterium]|nr:hypothetical protein [Nitrospirota bacterium]